jgi:hypothetical protein
VDIDYSELPSSLYSDRAKRTLGANLVCHFDIGNVFSDHKTNVPDIVSIGNDTSRMRNLQ